MSKNEIENLIFLKYHLESEIKILNNDSIKMIANENNLNFFSRYLENQDTLEKICLQKKKLLNDIENYLLQHCCHEWTKDYIDVNPELSKPIYYCESCGIFKN